jgi:serine/threonine-protein kinase RsbW
MDTLIVTATPDSLSSIRAYVMEAAAAAGLGIKAASRLCLAVHEIATNAMAHGHAAAHDQGVLRVQAQIDPQSLTLILEDAGEPYDPRQNPPPHHQDAALEDRLYLTIQGVDEFFYDRVGDWNHNIFVMNRAEISAEDILQNNKLADDLIHVILPIGIALSAEKNFDQLLESILLQAKSV